MRRSILHDLNKTRLFIFGKHPIPGPCGKFLKVLERVLIRYTGPDSKIKRCFWPFQIVVYGLVWKQPAGKSAFCFFQKQKVFIKLIPHFRYLDVSQVFNQFVKITKWIRVNGIPGKIVVDYVLESSDRWERALTGFAAVAVPFLTSSIEVQHSSGTRWMFPEPCIVCRSSWYGHQGTIGPR